MSSTERGFYAGTRSFSWLAELIRLPIDQVNFLVCQFTALAFAVLYRKVFCPQNISAEIRHVVALAIGIGLGYFCFGYQISHLIVQATLSYIIMNTVSPHIMHILVLFVSLMYLSSMHLMRLTYDYGGWTVDVTGPMMITTQKVTSLAFSLHDGHVQNEEKLTPEQRKHAVRHCPSVLEFFSYIFHFQALMCGPLIFYNDYVDFVEGRNCVKNVSPTLVVCRKVFVSIFCALFLVTIVPYFPITYLQDPKFLNHTPWYSKLTYLIFATSVVRSKYYHAWLLGEAVCNASGMGFNGYTNDGRSKWDLMSNVDIIRFEFSLNFRETLETWNKSTQMWLRTIAYDRAQSRKTLWTYVLSAMWHGFYPGYYFTFLGGAIFTLAARSVPKATAQILEAHGYLVQHRGSVTVKGKGQMDTYFVLGRRRGPGRQMSVGGRTPSARKSLAAAVYGLVRARRNKRGLGSSLSVPGPHRHRSASPGGGGSTTTPRLQRIRSETPDRSRRSTVSKGGGRLRERRMTDAGGSSSHSYPELRKVAVDVRDVA